MNTGNRRDRVSAFYTVNTLACAPRQSVLTLHKPVVGTIVNRQVFFLLLGLIQCEHGLARCVRGYKTWTIDPVCFPCSYRLFPELHVLALEKNTYMYVCSVSLILPNIILLTL